MLTDDSVFLLLLAILECCCVWGAACAQTLSLSWEGLLTTLIDS